MLTDYETAVVFRCIGSIEIEADGDALNLSAEDLIEEIYARTEGNVPEGARNALCAKLEVMDLSLTEIKALLSLKGTSTRGPKMSIRTLQDLFNAMKAQTFDVVDVHGQFRTDLPTFGGKEPADKIGIWSWDSSNLLIGTCQDDLAIISRQEWFSCP